MDPDSFVSLYTYKYNYLPEQASTKHLNQEYVDYPKKDRPTPGKLTDSGKDFKRSDSSNSDQSSQYNRQGSLETISEDGKSSIASSNERNTKRSGSFRKVLSKMFG